MVLRKNGNKFFIIFIKGEDILLINSSYHDMIDFTFTCITFKWCLHFLLFPIENNTIYRGSGKAYFRLPSKNF